MLLCTILVTPITLKNYLENDDELVAELKKAGVSYQSYNGSLLWEPSAILKKDETPYKVFTPYYKKGCLLSVPQREPLT